MNESQNNTTGDIAVLGSGPSKPIIFERPTSGGRRSTTPKLLQRSGSTLEILPAEADLPLGSTSQTENKHFVKSVRRKNEDTKCEPLNYNDGNQCTSHKKIILPFVKRDFEKHGMPRNEEIESFVRSSTPTNDDSHTKRNLSSRVSSLEKGVNGIQLDTNSSNRDSVRQVTTVTDDCYVSHSKEMHNGNKECLVNKIQGITEESDHLQVTGKVESDIKTKQATSLNDDYYISHRQRNSQSLGSNVQENEPEAIEKKDTENALNIKGNSSSDESDDEDERKAPIELLGEFLETVMDQDFENAQKLCKMILIYEPENKEANEFKPLIDEELRKERERQLWGSSSSEEESSDEDDSDEESDSSEESDDEEKSDNSGKKSFSESDSN